jgi:hypothetical protein
MTIDDTTVRSKRESMAHKTCPAINPSSSESVKFMIKSCNLFCLEIKVVEHMRLQKLEVNVYRWSSPAPAHPPSKEAKNSTFPALFPLSQSGEVNPFAKENKQVIVVVVCWRQKVQRGSSIFLYVSTCEC